MRRIMVVLATMAAMVVVYAGAALAMATSVNEVEPNDSIAQAQNIDRYFSLDSDPNITDSTTVPHATVNGTGDGTYDYYSFTVPQAGVSTIGVFDIDGGMPSFDSTLWLYDSKGAFLTAADDSYPEDPGSVHPYDTYLQYNFPSAGTYYIKVSRFPDDPVPAGARYTLNVSVPNHTTHPGKPIKTPGARSERFPVAFTLDATRGCAGELIHITGTLHTVNHFVGELDANGNPIGQYHVNSTFHLAGVTGVGLDPVTLEPTGTEYVIPAAGAAVENSTTSGQIITGTVDINLVIGKGQLDDQVAFARVHYIVEFVDGEPTVKVETIQFHFKCQPGNASATATANATATARATATASPTATASLGTGGAPLAMGAGVLLVGAGLAARRFF